MKTARYISLGAGVQSSVLLLMVDGGDFGEVGVDAPDIAYFADTGAEPPDVYQHLDWLETVVQNVRIERVGERNLADDVLAGVNHDGDPYGGGQIPQYTLTNGAKGMNMRQCTSRYKIRPIERAFRAANGNPHPARLSVEAWLGISADEVYRMKDDPRKSYTRVYPLAERGLRRSDCAKWFAERYPNRRLPRSACYFCPFHNADEWIYIRDNFPAVFVKAVEMDAEIRTQAPIKPGLTRFLHQRRVPLAEAVALDEKALGARDMQLTLSDEWLNECEGVCGV